MSVGLIAQYVVLVLIVLASVLVVFRKLAPQLSSRWLASLALRLDRPSRATWSRALCRRLQPKQATGRCGVGCAACGACGLKLPALAQTKSNPLTLKSHGR